MSKSRPPVELSGRHHNLPRGHVGGRSGGSSRGSMTEFLVEVTPGRELRYRSSLSFRLAIRSAEIPPEARVYHRARRTWLPITAHPEYRRIQAEQTAPHWLLPTFPVSAEEGDASEPGNQPSFKRRVASGWTFLKAIARKRRTRPSSTPTTEIASDSADVRATPPEPADRQEPSRAEVSNSSESSDPSPNPRRQWTFYS